MNIVYPRYIALDSSTLVNVSRDFWSQEASQRRKAKQFLDELAEQSILIAFSFTHLVEFLRLEDTEVVRNRFEFLSRLPLIAWVRPYDRSWFTGTVVDLHRRELHAFLHDAADDWGKIVNNVRNDIWETGVGSDMFVSENPVWAAVIEDARKTTQEEKRIASIARTDSFEINDLTLTEISDLPLRPADERVDFLSRSAAQMDFQLKEHGDKKLDDSREASIQFARATLARIGQLEAEGGNIRQKIIDDSGVPISMVTADMTVGELGELGILAKRMQIIAEGISPPVKATIETIGESTLPSLAIETRLWKMQQNEQRVYGSNFGDAYLAVLSLYADFVEVDKRTYPFLKRIQRNDPALLKLMGVLIREPDYSKIPSHCT